MPPSCRDQSVFMMDLLIKCPSGVVLLAARAGLAFPWALCSGDSGIGDGTVVPNCCWWHWLLPAGDAPGADATLRSHQGAEGLRGCAGELTEVMEMLLQAAAATCCGLFLFL